MFDTERLDPPRPGELQVCFATDGGYAARIEVAAYCLLRRASCPVRIVIIGSDDVVGQFPRLERALEQHLSARMDVVTPDFLRQAGKTHSHKRFPITAFGRMLIPYLLSGRVLYLDGDTYVNCDAAAFLSEDLEGQPAAAAIDQLFRRQVRYEQNADNITDRRGQKIVAVAREQLAEVRGFSSDLYSYYNSGVMIFDCEAVQAHPDLMRDHLDHKRAAQYSTFDQDLINMIYAGRLKTLGPEWNVWPGVPTTRKAPFTVEDRAYFAPAIEDPKIVHFVHRPKPWSKFSIRHVREGFRWHRAYWRAEAELNRLTGQT